MFVLLFEANVDGTKAILGHDNNQYQEHLTAKAWFKPSHLQSHIMHRHDQVSIYYIGEDVLYLFDEKLELLDVLTLLQDMAAKELGDNNAMVLTQKLLGCNTGTVIHIKFK